MGNRATVVFTDGKDQFSPAVYLHWNGGPESVYGYLEELNRRKVRADQDYECARFIQLIGEMFDEESVNGLSLGVTNGPTSDKPVDLDKIYTDHGDNGLYLVNRTNGKMTVRRFLEQSNGKGDWSFKEMDSADVDRERDEAEKSDYRADFREFYEKLTAGKKIEAY